MSDDIKEEHEYRLSADEKSEIETQYYRTQPRYDWDDHARVKHTRRRKPVKRIKQLTHPFKNKGGAGVRVAFSADAMGYWITFTYYY